MSNTASGSGQMQDKEMLHDTLSSQKEMTNLYNMGANECAMPALRDEMMKILSEEHQMQVSVFTEMQKRGWYETPLAQEQKVQCAKQKFTAQG